MATDTPINTATQRLQREFATHLRQPESHPAPSHLENRRVQIYRDLVYKNIFNFISASFPVLKKISSDDYWHSLIRDFVANYQSESPYFSDLAREFVDFLEQRMQKNLSSDAGFMLELAQYEWAEVGLLLADGEVPSNCFAKKLESLSSAELIANEALVVDILKATPTFSSLAWPMQFQYAVHKISRDYVPEQPEDSPVFLISYRKADDSIRFMESNALTLRLLALCDEVELDVNGVLNQLCVEAADIPAETVRASGLEILVQLAGEDIVGFS